MLGAGAGAVLMAQLMGRPAGHNHCSRKQGAHQRSAALLARHASARAAAVDALLLDEHLSRAFAVLLEQMLLAWRRTGRRRGGADGRRRRGAVLLQQHLRGHVAVLLGDGCVRTIGGRG